MSSVARPRGPLPARVYWVRRLLIVATTLLLVVGVQRLLSYDGTAQDESAVAASVAGAPFELPSLALPSGSPEMIKPQPREAKLLPPQGACDPGDLVVTPVIEAANVGRPVQVILELTTVASPACTFEVSSESVAVNISTLTDARELLWTTQDCPAALAETTVVARQDVPGRAVAEWNGRRSDDRCSVLTEWVLPGDYVVEAVALGGTETGEQEFEIEGAVRETVTRSVTPTPSSSDSTTASPSPADRRSPSGSPTSR